MTKLHNSGEVVDLYPYGATDGRIYRGMCLKKYTKNTGNKKFLSFDAAMHASKQDMESTGITRNSRGIYTVRRGATGLVPSSYEVSWLKHEWDEADESDDESDDDVIYMRRKLLPPIISDSDDESSDESSDDDDMYLNAEVTVYSDTIYFFFFGMVHHVFFL